MRTIKPIILRLLVDRDQPQALRGMLNAVSDNQLHHFTDEQSLLALLQNIISAPGELPDHPEIQGTGLKGDLHA